MESNYLLACKINDARTLRQMVENKHKETTDWIAKQLALAEKAKMEIQPEATILMLKNINKLATSQAENGKTLLDISLQNPDTKDCTLQYPEDMPNEWKDKEIPDMFGSKKITNHSDFIDAVFKACDYNLLKETLEQYNFKCTLETEQEKPNKLKIEW